MKGLFIIVVLTINAVATSVVAQSPSRAVADASVEYDFMAPSGWKQSAKKGGYMLVNSSETVYVLVRPHSRNNFADAVRDTEIDNSYRVVGGPQDLANGGKTFRVTKQNPNGSTGVVDIYVMLAPRGGGVIVFALSSPSTAPAAFEAGLSVANSVTFAGSASTFSRRAAPSTATASATTGWGSKLSNRHLLFLYSGNGYFEERHIYLCSTGSFVQTTGSGGYTPGNADGGSFGARGGRRGQWAVTDSALTLQFQDGALVQYNITPRQASNEVGLNGKRYFLDGNAGC